MKFKVVNRRLCVVRLQNRARLNSTSIGEAKQDFRAGRTCRRLIKYCRIINVGTARGRSSFSLPPPMTRYIRILYPDLDARLTQLIGTPTPVSFS